MSRRSSFSLPGGPSYEEPLYGRPVYAGPDYRGPVYAGPGYRGSDYAEPISAQPVDARPGPNHIMFRETGVDWIHSGQYPLSQLPGFEMQYHFM